jgi:hypothetical protein
MANQSIYEQLRQLEKVHEQFQVIVGSHGTSEGSMRQGFAICEACPKEQEKGTGGDGGGGGGGGGGPTTGACCVGSDCSIQTPSGCEGMGGIYQGDGTLCVPNPCDTGALVGACCHDDGSCTIETSVSCAAIPGIYRGDGTNCADPCLTHTGCPECTDPIFPTICNWGTYGCMCCATGWQCCITTEPGPLGGIGVPFCCDPLHTCGPHGCLEALGMFDVF